MITDIRPLGTAASVSATNSFESKPGIATAEYGTSESMTSRAPGHNRLTSSRLLVAGIGPTESSVTTQTYGLERPHFESRTDSGVISSRAISPSTAAILTRMPSAMGP